jgi:NADH dehydrogenase
VQDVAEAIARILADPAAAGRTYELAGPIGYTLRELVEMTLRLVERRPPLLPVPFGLAKVQARLFEFLPNPPLTAGQVDLLKDDNLASGLLPGFRDLGVEPRSVAEIVPTYVGPSRGPA